MAIVSITIATLIALIAGILAVGSQFFARDVGIRKNLTMLGGWVFAIFAVFIILGAVGIDLGFDVLNQPAFGRATLGVTEPGVTLTIPPTPQVTSAVPLPLAKGACAPGVSVEDTTVTLSAINKFTAAATGGTHRYRVNGGPALTVANAGTFTASPGDVINILFMNGSETDSIYYSAISTETIPCSGTVTFSKELYSNSSVVIDVFNEEGNLIDTAGVNETLAAGDVVTLVAKLRGAFQTGHPYGGVIVANYPNPAYDRVIVDFVEGEPVKVGKPTYAATTNGTFTTESYVVPPIIGTDVITGTVTIDVDNTRAPTAVPSDAINLTYYPYDYFINQDTGGSYDGPAAEDELGTQTKKYSLQYAVAVT